ncbi:sterol desaturase family protein [Paraglaciecola sp.]|uniref:sterol desaturase family protein n=1 Tax=Paraglaciecola sp. TaxID=1920173 RepID=UPI0030F49AFA
MDVDHFETLLLEAEKVMELKGENIEFAFNTSPIMQFIFLVFLFNIFIALVEMLVDAVWLEKRSWKDTGANMFIFFINTFLSTTVIGVVAIVALIPFSLLQFYTFPINLSTWMLAILAADFLYYWMHRIEHKSRILWAFHVVHHSSEDYNLTIPKRLSWVQDLQEWVFLVPMVLIGFDVFQTIVAFVLVSQYQNWIHTKKIGKLGVLEYIFNTPSAHRVHHGTAKHHIDKNFGGMFIIWDRMFGTYQHEDEEVVYGITRNIKTTNPLKINFIEYWHIWKTVRMCSRWRDRFKAVFGPLNWQPKNVN